MRKPEGTPCGFENDEGCGCFADRKPYYTCTDECHKRYFFTKADLSARISAERAEAEAEGYERGRREALEAVKSYVIRQGFGGRWVDGIDNLLLGGKG